MNGSIKPGPVPRSWKLYYRCPVAPGERRRGDQKRETLYNLSKAEATKYLATVLGEIARGEYVPECVTTLGDYLRDLVDDPDLAGSTKQRYVTVVRQIVEHIDGGESLALGKVTAQHVERLMKRLRKQGGDDARPLSSTSCMQHFAVLRKGLRRATRQRLIPYNPCEAVKPPKARKHDVPIMEASALGAFLDAMRGTTFYPAVVLAGLGGLRRGEVLALRWCDIDFATGVVSVARSVEETNSGLAIKKPKSGKPRPVALPGSALAALQAHRVEQGLIAERMGAGWNPEGIVVPNIATGRVWFPSNFSGAYSRAVRRAGFDVGFHALRHGYVSLLVSVGIDVKTVQSLAGHGSASFTLDRYGHLWSNAQVQAAGIVDAAMRATGFGVKDFKSDTTLADDGAVTAP